MRCWTGRTAWKERWGSGWHQVPTLHDLWKKSLIINHNFYFLIIILRFLDSDYINCLCRYFQCQPKYGLFAPVHKVTRIGFPSTTPAKAKTTARKVVSTPSGLKRSPSASSISTMSSVTSSVSTKPSRTGLVRHESVPTKLRSKLTHYILLLALW